MNQEREVLFWRVAIMGVVIAFLAALAKLALMVAKPTVVQMLLPLRALYTRDHAITEKGVAFLAKALDVAVWMLLAAAFFTVIYAVIGRYASSRLPLRSPQPADDWRPASVSEIGGIVVILVGGLGLRILQLNQGFSYDEMFTACNFVDTDSFWKTISTYVVFNNHIAYSVAARFAQLILGRAEWVLRLPALLFGLAAILAVWRYGRRLGGPSLGLWAAAYLALFPLHIVYSELARGYTGMALFVFLSSVFFIRVLDQGRRWDAVMYALSSILAVYFHLYAILVVGVQIALVLGLVAGHLKGAKGFDINRQSFRLLWFVFFVVIVGCVLCYLPVAASLAVNIQNRGRSSFQPWFPWQVADDLSGNPGAIIVVGMAIVAWIGLKTLWTSQGRLAGAHPGVVAPGISPCSAAVPSGLFTAGEDTGSTCCPHNSRMRLLAVYCATILVLPMAAVMVARPSDLYTRFFIYFLPWYALLLGLGIGVIRQKLALFNRPVRLLARGVLAGIFVGVMWQWLSAVSWNYASGPFGGYIAPYRAVGQAMRMQAGSNVCFCAFGEGCEELSYYAGQKLKILNTMNDLLECRKSYDEVRVAYNVTIWDTPEQKSIARFLTANGKAQHFKESRPCQEVILFTIAGKGKADAN